MTTLFAHAMHPRNPAFFPAPFGWLGGPPLYTDKRGHPMLRRRHFAAPIGAAERDGWLLCFTQALEETVPSRQLRDIVLAPVTRLAEHYECGPYCSTRPSPPIRS